MGGEKTIDQLMEADPEMAEEVKNVAHYQRQILVLKKSN